MQRAGQSSLLYSATVQTELPKTFPLSVRPGELITCARSQVALHMDCDALYFYLSLPLIIFIMKGERRTTAFCQGGQAQLDVTFARREQLRSVKLQHHAIKAKTSGQRQARF